MFRNAFRLPFTLLGIPIQLDLSFLFILPILVWIIANNLAGYIEVTGLDVDAESLSYGLKPYVLGFAAAVGLFASVVIHELGHAVVGRHYGFETKSITLWLLGGMAQFEKLPRRGRSEAIMAIAGPITSFALAGACWLTLLVTPHELPEMLFVLTYLLWMNMILATFNLLPALPLDGGRVFRSLLALRVGHLKATLIAASTSKFVAISLGLLGLLSMNFFLILIAFFIYMGVTGETQMTMAAEALHGIKVRDLMTRDVKTVPPETRVSELVERMFQEKHLAYPVVELSGRILGVVRLSDVQAASDGDPRSSSSLVTDVMSDQFGAIGANDSALDAFQRLGEVGAMPLLVVDPKRCLSGIVSKTDLIRAVQVRLVEVSLNRTLQSL